MLRQILEILSRVVTWWVVVPPWQRALRLRLGTHQTELGAGIHLKIPYIHQVTTRERISRIWRSI